MYVRGYKTMELTRMSHCHVWDVHARPIFTPGTRLTFMSDLPFEIIICFDSLNVLNTERLVDEHFESIINIHG